MTSPTSAPLRAAQEADSSGMVQATSITPGRYSGRTGHIHLKALLDKVSALTAQLGFR